MKKPTMQTIADELNISKSLVSKALSNRHGVSEETKREIILTASRLGYRINSSVMTVKESQTGTIALLLPREDLRDLGYWGRIVHSIEEELSGNLFSLILSGVDTEKPSSTGLPSCITDMKVDGAMVMGRIPATYVHAIHTKGIPIVLLDSDDFGGLKLDHVMADNFGGGYDATKLLLDKGHRRIGFVGDLSYAYSFRERHRGFVTCIQEFKQSHPEIELEAVEITGPREDSERPSWLTRLREVFDARDNVPTSILCVNDGTAFTAIKEMHSMGLRCPDDVSVVGFDNLTNDDWLDPRLTSVDACISAMGTRAVELILRRVDEPRRRPETVLIATEIVERASVDAL
jgi:DNA-binding LacI/PurR family transcriptional regulator